MTTRREPLFRFYVRSIRMKGDQPADDWTPATRGGLPVLCNRDELAPDSPVEPFIVSDPNELRRYAFEVLIPERTFSDLDGATEPGNLDAYPATPGEFAARWNSWDEQRRATWLQAMNAIVQAALPQRYISGTVDGIRPHRPMTPEEAAHSKALASSLPPIAAWIVSGPVREGADLGAIEDMG